MSIILLFSCVFEFTTFDLTVLKICLDLISLIDLLNRISLYGSPSSTIKAFLITFSSVIKFPNILIFSTKNFSLSSKYIFILILSLSTIFS